MTDVSIRVSDEIEVNVKVACIVLGADVSLIQINDVDGFSFQKVSVADFKYKDKILLANQKINNKYYLSQLQSDLNDTDSSSFVCLTKEVNFTVRCPDVLATNGVVRITDKFGDLPELVDFQDEQFELINRIISKLMLLKNLDIGIFEVFYEFSYSYFNINFNKLNTILIEDAKSLITKKYKIETTELGDINDFLSDYNQSYRILKSIIDGFTYSFKLLDNAKSFEQLISVLEIMLLPRNQQKKKETLSKMVAVLVGKDDADIKNIYYKLKSFYRYRSESTHEGIDVNIGINELVELKELTRLSILRYINEAEKSLQSNSQVTFEELKLNLITSLKTTVLTSINSNVLPA
ncbi:hypothetical protein I6N90_11715 [Paenibacillus sp. GSMTC-2017]|uniref:hypothetical protein n=1 Tax=Paenibacillus sp. GSMTC-2017 TaxID=2794350 RepID=UPI0018D7D606|nr:hypothetical protein [Paenibacillus sp. GSMTC-2017]MBH5318472.1 hypothetical protein [Paenibacillus sp. GSMTC-2017]